MASANQNKSGQGGRNRGRRGKKHYKQLDLAEFFKEKEKYEDTDKFISPKAKIYKDRIEKLAQDVEEMVATTPDLEEQQSLALNLLCSFYHDLLEQHSELEVTDPRLQEPLYHLPEQIQVWIMDNEKIVALLVNTERFLIKENKLMINWEQGM